MEAAAPAVVPESAARKKKLLIGAAAGLAMVAGLGWVTMNFVLKEEPPPPPPVRKAAAKQPDASPSAPAEGPKGPIATTKEVVAKTEANRTDPTNEVVAAATGPAAPAASAPAATTPAVVAPPVSVPAAPSGPPPASAAFKAWVQGLKISGVRGGANPRVFIERTAYGPGDLVNPQLGILFDSYNAETRTLIFKDKSGAVVERKN